MWLCRSNPPGLLYSDRPHDEDRVAGWIEQVKGPRPPVLIFRRSQGINFRAPLPVIAIGVIHVKRNTSISAVPAHGTIQRHLNCPAGDSQQSRVAVPGHFESHAKPELLNVEPLGDGQIFCGENGSGSFHNSGILADLPLHRRSRHVSRPAAIILPPCPSFDFLC